MSTFDEERLTGIGGSDAPAVVGISPWATPYDLYCQKLQLAPPLATSEPMRWGSLLEPVIRDEYSRRTGRTVETLAMLRHPTHQYMIAHVDGRVDNTRILECKTARSAHGWGEPGTHEIPLQYFVQVHHYLIVSGAQIADLAVLIGGNDFRIYEVHADAEVARELVGREHQFWWRVANRDPPGPSNLRDALHRWGHLAAAGTVVASEAELLAVEQLHQIGSQLKELAAAAEKARVLLMQALGENGDHLVDEAGSVLATWKLDKGRKGYKVEARDPQRRFLLKG